MALHLFTQSIPGGGWTEVSIGGQSIFDMKLRVSYSTPAELSFSMFAPEHQLPFTPKSSVIFYDDTAHTFNDPTFEGFIAEISPASNNLIEITCYDNTKRITQDVVIMSTAWQEGDYENTEPPSEGIGALPRLVFNVTIDNDPDFAFMRTEGITQQTGENPTDPPEFVIKRFYSIGEMIQIILDDAFEPLLWINSANADGSSYYPAELGQMAYQPQEKQVFESESIRSGLDRLLTQQPAVRYLWIPGPNNRKFKFVDARTSPAVTLTLNDFDGVDNPVLSMQMRRILDHVKTAIKVYGPESTNTQTISTSNLTAPSLNNGALRAYDGVVLETYSDGTGALPRKAIAYRKYQIVDPDKRRSSNMLSTTYVASAGSYNFFSTRSPTVEVSWDGSSWMSVWGWTFDSQNGIVDFGSNYIYFHQSTSPDGTTQNFFPPTHVRLTHSYYTNPITVRWPTSGYIGTGFDVAGIQSTHRFYDEMLAVGYERGIPVTTLSRVAQFKELARRVLEQERDIAYVGGCTLEGLDYRFLRLNKRINIASVDQDGATITTGWENVGAILTEVEYDYAEDMTSLSFSHDLADYLGWSIDSLKERLKIEANRFRKLNLIVSGPIDFINPVYTDTFFYGPDGLESGIEGDF